MQKTAGRNHIANHIITPINPLYKVEVNWTFYRLLQVFSAKYSVLSTAKQLSSPIVRTAWTLREFQPTSLPYPLGPTSDLHHQPTPSTDQHVGKLEEIRESLCSSTCSPPRSPGNRLYTMKRL